MSGRSSQDCRYLAFFDIKSFYASSLQGYYNGSWFLSYTVFLQPVVRLYCLFLRSVQEYSLHLILDWTRRKFDDLFLWSNSTDDYTMTPGVLLFRGSIKGGVRSWYNCTIACTVIPMARRFIRSNCMEFRTSCIHLCQPSFLSVAIFIIS